MLHSYFTHPHKNPSSGKIHIYPNRSNAFPFYPFVHASLIPTHDIYVMSINGQHRPWDWIFLLDISIYKFKRQPHIKFALLFTGIKFICDCQYYVEKDLLDSHCETFYGQAEGFILIYSGYKMIQTHNRSNKQWHHLTCH